MFLKYFNHHQTTALMKAISAKRIELRAGDLFAVSKHLIPPVLKMFYINFDT